MRVLIAPDCFGDSLTAVQAAQSVAAGWRVARPADDLVLAPQSDGGPGFLEVLAACDRRLQRRHRRVSGPLSGQVEAGWLFEPETGTAYLECAQACGLSLLGGPPTPETAVAAHSRGLGELIGAALECGACTIVVGLGGSGCTDGGRGMIEALGGTERARDRLAGVALIVATDVDNPLLGPQGAAAVFGPQKGADEATVELLEGRLVGWVGELEAVTGRVVRQAPGAGAAGGLGAALLALGGRRESGAGVIAGRTGLAEQIADCDLLLTGEGRLDGQSLNGKVVGALARMAQPGAVPVIVLAGQVALDPAAVQRAGILAAHSIAEYCGSVRRAIDEAAEQLAGLAERTARGLARE